MSFLFGRKKPTESFVQILQRNLAAEKSAVETKKDSVQRAQQSSVNLLETKPGRVFNDFRKVEQLIDPAVYAGLLVRFEEVIRSPISTDKLGKKQFNEANQAKLRKITEDIFDLAAKELLNGQGNLNDQVVELLQWQNLPAIEDPKVIAAILSSYQEAINGFLAVEALQNLIPPKLRDFPKKIPDELLDKRDAAYGAIGNFSEKNKAHFEEYAKDILQHQGNFLVAIEAKPLPPSISFDFALKQYILDRIAADIKSNQHLYASTMDIAAPLINRQSRESKEDISTLLATAREACNQPEKGKYFPALEKLLDKYIRMADFYKKSQMTLDTDAELTSPSSRASSLASPSSSSDTEAPATPVSQVSPRSPGRS